MKTKQPNKLSLLIALLVLTINSHGQAPDLQWQKSYGGRADEIAKNAQQTFDKGYVIGGWSSSNNGDITGSHGSTDYWILKLDSLGNKVWQKTLGGSNADESADDLGGIAVQQTMDSGYIVAANTQSSDGDVTNYKGSKDFWIVKLNASGVIQWQKTYGGSSYDEATCIQQTADSGYIVAGSSASSDGDVTVNHGSLDYWVIKLDKTGKLLWQKSLGGVGYETAMSVLQTKDKNFIVAGFTESANGDITNPLGSWDIWVVMLNGAGDIVWEKSYGGSGEDYATSIMQPAEGGFVVAGYTSSSDKDVSESFGKYDSWIFKINDSGAIEWQKSLGTPEDDAATCIQQSKDGNYVISHITYAKGPRNFNGINVWLTKIRNKELLWEKYMGGNGDDIAGSVWETRDSGYVLGTYTNSVDGDVTVSKGSMDYWIVKLKPNYVLPVKFISFTAAKKQSGVYLNWKTTGEINTAYFTIEKSNNGYNFFTIGKVGAGSTNTMVNSYSFTDTASNTAKVYYRIKQVDADGKFVYSNINALPFEQTKVRIYPNPGPAGKVTIELPQIYKHINVAVTDLSGKKVYERNYIEANNIPLNLAGKHGVFFLRIKYDNTEEVHKLVIQ